MLSKLLLAICPVSFVYPHLTFAQQWLANGPAEYASRCGPGTEASGEYVCITYPSDILTAATGGVYQGYANTSGTGESPHPILADFSDSHRWLIFLFTRETGFALVPPGDGVGESSLLTTADRQVSIDWEGDSTAHVTIRNMEGGAWNDVQEVDVENPYITYTFIL